MRRYRPHLFVLFVLGVAYLTGLQQFFSNVVTDSRFGWVMRPATGEVVVVGIDSPSMEAVGTWPWPRSVHAKILEYLTAAGASEVAFDVDFSSASSAAGDSALATALEKAGGSVILPTFEQWVKDSAGNTVSYVNRPAPSFAKNSWPAVVNVVPDPDGIVRNYYFGKVIGGEFLPSIGALLAGQYKNDEGRFNIDYGIRPSSIPVVSAKDALNLSFRTANLLKNKKVLVGSVALELGDRLNVPGGKILPGVIVQALATESILQGRTLLVLSTPAWLGTAILFLIMFLAWERLPAAARVALLLAVAAVAESAAIYIQTLHPVSIDTSLLHAAIAAYLLAVGLNEIDVQSIVGKVAEKRFQQITRSVGDGLVCADHTGIITAWNPAAEAVFGYKNEEALGQPFAMLVAGNTFSLLRLPRQALELVGGLSLELRGRRKSGEEFPAEACFSAWEGANDIQYGVVLRDISVRKKEEERIRFLAENDTLTSLANRLTLHRHLAKLTHEGSPVSLVLIDIDRFKEINSTRGYEFGDRVLCAFAERLKLIAPSNSLIARLGGDEFAVGIAGKNAEAEAAQFAAGIQQSLEQAHVEFEVMSVPMSVCVGLASFPMNCSSADELISNADLALNRARAEGRGRLHGYENRLRKELEERLKLEVELREAFDKNQFEVFYQPQIDLKDDRIVGAEALLRWRHPVRGVISPGEFIGVLNSSSLSNSVARWIMETACMQAVTWNAKTGPLKIGVNLSPSQFQGNDLPLVVAQVLAKTGLRPQLLELEVTEEILLDDTKKVKSLFESLRALGVRLALDDFGTGYSSLSHLQKFSLETLKIDRSFVGDLVSNPQNAAIATSSILLGKNLGLSVTAEGVEDAATAEQLKMIGCDSAQGYFFGRPMPAADFEKLLLQYAGTTAAA